MCGINGLIGAFRQASSEVEGFVSKMNDALGHRGPDDAGLWGDAEGGVYLGHRRLSILDLSPRGHQPMAGLGGTMITYNGEIYNYKALRKTFRDGPFVSDSDTEVLLRLYERHGPECLDLLNGMFAFAIWDAGKRELFLARDRLGIKPLYYTQQNGVFAFSSEIKALLTLPWVKRELDEGAFYDFLTFGHVAPPETTFRHIAKLEPGHAMVVDRDGIKVCRRYWQPSYRNMESATEEMLVESIGAAIEKSVERRLVSDVPVGVFLSGGVDSSAIVSAMAKNGASRIRTFSIGFAGADEYDERKHAAGVAKLFKTEHEERIVDARDVEEFLPKVVDIYDEPLADATSVPLYFLAELARQSGTPVVLTGDGPDELFCGYRNWRKYVRFHGLYAAFRCLPRPVKRAAAWAAGMGDKNAPLYEILARAAADQEPFWPSAGGFKEATKQSFLSPEYRRRMAGNSAYSRVENLRRAFDGIETDRPRSLPIDWMCFAGAFDIIPNYYLYRADHMGMAHGVELRVPYLDHEFVDLGLSIPAWAKMKGGEPKYILKKALEAELPNSVLYRRKQGFNVPLLPWANKLMVGYVEQNLVSFCRQTGLFSEAPLRGLLDEVRSGAASGVSRLWHIYFVMCWYRRWFL